MLLRIYPYNTSPASISVLAPSDEWPPPGNAVLSYAALVYERLPLLHSSAALCSVREINVHQSRVLSLFLIPSFVFNH